MTLAAAVSVLAAMERARGWGCGVDSETGGWCASVARRGFDFFLAMSHPCMAGGLEDGGSPWLGMQDSRVYVCV